MESLLTDLANRLAESRSICFVGAGCSAWAGYPLWPELIDRIYRRARAFDWEIPDPGEAQSAGLDLRMLAEIYGSVLMTKPGRLAGAVEKALDRKQGKPSCAVEKVLDRRPRQPKEIHHRLTRLPFRHFITTNYDDLLEQACARPDLRSAEPIPVVAKSARFASDFSDFIANLAEDRQVRTVLHLHGRRGSDMTLSMTDYNEQYLGEAMSMHMFATLSTSTVVFVGTSLTDPDLMEQLRRTNFHGGAVTRHYAFLPGRRHRDVYRDTLQRTYGIQPIWYEVENDSHSALLQKLDRLQELVDERRSLSTDERPGRNHAPVVRPPTEEKYARRIEEAVGRVKEAIRDRDSAIVRIDGLPERFASWILRRIVQDYGRLPASNHFSSVIWLSEASLGLMPPVGDQQRRPRGSFQAAAGSIAQTLGFHRVHTSPNPDDTIMSIKRVLTGGPHSSAEPTLVVVDELPELRLPEELEGDEYSDLERLLLQLPQGSTVVLRARWLPPLTERQGTDPARLPANLVSVDLKDFAGDFRHGWSRTDPVVSVEASDANAGLGQLIEELNADVNLRRSACDVLMSLAVLSTGTTTAVLAGMLGAGQSQIHEALRELAAAGLVEEYPSGADQLDTQWPKEIGLRAAVRRAVFRRCWLEWDETGTGGIWCLPRRVDDLLDWADQQVKAYHRWEHNEPQRGLLLARLGDLLAVFEATAFVVDQGMHADHDPVLLHMKKQMLEQGLFLVDVLMAVGRGGEASDLLEYLEGSLDQDSELAPNKTSRFKATVSVLKARKCAVLGKTAFDFARGLEITEPLIKRQLGTENTVDLARVERARLLIHQTRLRRRSLDSLDHLESIENPLALLRQITHFGELLAGRAWPDSRQSLLGFLGHSQPRSGSEPELDTEPERERILLEAAVQWVQAVDLGFRDDVSDTLPPADDQLKLLKTIEFSLFGTDRNRRLRGYHACVRGDVLLKAHNLLAARRAYARAYTISIEYRDSPLEAQSLLGLARCDRRMDLANQAAELFATHYRAEDRERASDAARSLGRHEASDTDRLVNHPKLLVVYSAETRTLKKVANFAHAVLAGWSYPCSPMPADTEARGAALVARLDALRVSPDYVAIMQVNNKSDLLACILGAAGGRPGGESTSQRTRLDSALVFDVSEVEEDDLVQHPELSGAQRSYRKLDPALGHIELEDLVRDQLAMSYRSVEQLSAEVRSGLSEGAVVATQGIGLGVGPSRPT